MSRRGNKFASDPFIEVDKSRVAQEEMLLIIYQSFKSFVCIADGGEKTIRSGIAEHLCPIPAFVSIKAALCLSAPPSNKKSLLVLSSAISGISFHSTRGF
jgi:hypothetical protein